MRFTELCIPGAYRVDREPTTDNRGFFARTWCAEEFADRGLCACFAQASISFNNKKGTLRGLHYQCAPHEEAKLVRCARGGIYDVLLDLRPHSPAYGTWASEILTGDNGRQVYIPEGVAHGFQTLLHESEVHYMISKPYNPACARGVRWDDPAFAIEWPDDIRTISKRDCQFRGFAR